MEDGCYAVYKTWGVGGQHRQLMTTCETREEALSARERFANSGKDFASYVVVPLTARPPQDYGPRYGKHNTAKRK